MSLQVITAGMPRTGTTTLKVVLQNLGFGPCMHMQDLFNDPSRVDYWVELFETGDTDFSTLFAGYQSTVDFPACLLYRELLAEYPNVKVILNYRDPESWYESMHATVNPAATSRPETENKPQRFQDIAKTLALVDVYLLQRYFGGDFHDREKTIAAYEAHYEAVRATIPPAQLLEYRVEDGWEPLCEFLSVAVPETDFPRKNTRKEFQEKIGGMISGGGELRL